MLKTAWSLITGGITSIIGSWQIYLIVAGFSAALTGFGVWRVMSWEHQAQQVQVVTKTIKQIEYQDRVSTQIVTKYIKVQAADKAHTQQVIEEVPVHVTPQIDAAYPVPCSFGRVFNDAWHGPVPDPAACPDDSPSDTDLSTVAKAEAENAGKYDAISHELTALQDWVHQQQAAPQ